MSSEKSGKTGTRKQKPETVLNRGERLQEVVGKIPEGETLYYIIPQTDPDALGGNIGSCLMLKEMCEERSIDCKIFSCDSVDDDQNRSIFNRYNLDKVIRPISEIVWEEVKYVALVDSSQIKDGRIPEDFSVDPIIVIDHHRGSDVVENGENFVWNEDVGSACTLVAELMQELGPKFEEEDDHVLTIMALGIYTDTDKLAIANSRDVAAYNFLIKNMTSRKPLMELIRYPISRRYFENYRVALTNTQADGPRTITDVGFVSSKRGSDLARIADELIRTTETQLVIVWGILDDHSGIRGSVRCTDASIQLGEYLQRFTSNCGAKMDREGYAAGGFFIPLTEVKHLVGTELSKDTIEKFLNFLRAALAEIAFSD